MRSYTKLERHPELVTGRALFELFCHSQRSGEISRPSIAQAIRRGALTGRLLLLIAMDSYAAGFSSSPPPCSASCFCISSCFLALASARFCCFSPISCSAPSSSRTAFSPPVTLAEAGVNDAKISALAIAVTRRNRHEQTRHRLRRHKKCSSLAAAMNVATLAEGDHLLDQRTNCLGFRKGRFDAIFYDDGGHQVAQKSAAVAGITSEFISCFTMPHGSCLLSDIQGIRASSRIVPVLLAAAGYYPRGTYSNLAGADSELSAPTCIRSSQSPAESGHPRPLSSSSSSSKLPKEAASVAAGRTEVGPGCGLP